MLLLGQRVKGHHRWPFFRSTPPHLLVFTKIEHKKFSTGAEALLRTTTTAGHHFPQCSRSPFRTDQTLQNTVSAVLQALDAKHRVPLLQKVHLTVVFAVQDTRIVAVAIGAADPRPDATSAYLLLDLQRHVPRQRLGGGVRARDETVILLCDTTYISASKGFQ